MDLVRGWGLESEKSETRIPTPKPWKPGPKTPRRLKLNPHPKRSVEPWTGILNPGSSIGLRALWGLCSQGSGGWPPPPLRADGSPGVLD